MGELDLLLERWLWDLALLGPAPLDEAEAREPEGW